MRNSYHTQQRCALLAFLSAHADEQFTVEQLLAAMGDEAPGRSTVYRALDRLVEEGTVRPRAVAARPIRPWTPATATRTCTSSVWTAGG